MSIDYLKDGNLLKVIGHPVRLRILKGLIKHECNVSRIVSSLKIPQSTVSQHLGILRARQIIRPRKEGVRTCYSVVDDKVRRIIAAIDK